MVRPGLWGNSYQVEQFSVLGRESSLSGRDSQTDGASALLFAKLRSRQPKKALIKGD